MSTMRSEEVKITIFIGWYIFMNSKSTIVMMLTIISCVPSIMILKIFTQYTIIPNHVMLFNITVL